MSHIEHKPPIQFFDVYKYHGIAGIVANHKILRLGVCCKEKTPLTPGGLASTG